MCSDLHARPRRRRTLAHVDDESSIKWRSRSSSGVLAHAFSPPHGRFHLDGDEYWVDGATELDPTAFDLESVAIHEIGHLLGLGHSSVEEAIMYPSISGGVRKVELAADDVEGVQEYEGRTLKIAYAKSQKKKPQSPSATKPVSPYNLFVGNLSYEARAKNLREFFSSEGGKVVSAEVIFHENPRRASGYGFVSFSSKAAAEAALTAFDGKTFLDRPIRVTRSKRFERQSAPPKVKQEDPSSSETGAAAT